LAIGIIVRRYIKKIISEGDENGNEMIVKFQLPSGLEIYGLPTKNFYGGHWDLGPTWNYAVMADQPFLVDAGRSGQGKNLVGMMEAAGICRRDLEYVLISHSHEDHDGGLAELVDSNHLGIKAHAVYDLLIRQYPEAAPAGHRKNFPAKCWHCPMPEAFWTAALSQIFKETRTDWTPIPGLAGSAGPSTVLCRSVEWYPTDRQGKGTGPTPC
jgi:glyoxylase-like metal-dependent hydrolase (beta-lactamase superfamily II)